ncbi:hypothetical protein CI238_07041 [Colletotrichum incanum]|uniref:Uncharacterized protein n=1 Tax=Colletotrichum incanum TaxID=1573173 RepID=A0A161VP34_COLIC|nr:hypothetical protein CI238_07041 [Colletotrichum incanum]OHW96189.1 DUF1768-domain-containing protein [Colletotrichum incanum]
MDTSPIYFWRETGQEGYLSQWWTKDPFTSTSSPASLSITFKTAEHYMMHGKALLFSDTDVALSVLKADHPRKAKALGRKVKGFDEALWNANRERIVREGNLLKFRCAPELKKKLLATGERELVEASPLDRIWGIGFSSEKASASDRSCWGLNLLGKVLMEVRAALREEQEKGEIDEQPTTRAKRRRAPSQGEAEQIEDGAFKSRRVGEQKAEATQSLG